MKVELGNSILGNGTSLNSFIPSPDKTKDKRNLEVDTCFTGNNELSGEGMKKNTAVAGDETAEQPISNQSNSEIEEISLKGLVVKSPDKSMGDVEHKKDTVVKADAPKSRVLDENINPAIKFRCPFCDLIVCGNAEFLKHILRHGENHISSADDKTTKQSENDENPNKIAIKNSKRLKFRLSHPSMKSSSTLSSQRSKQTKSCDPPISKNKAPLQAIKKNKKIPCKICKNMYYTHYMSSHMTVHTGERSFSCLFCPQAFAVYCNLKAHMGSLHKKTLNLASYRELSAEKSKMKQNQVKNSISTATASSREHTPETPVDFTVTTEPESNSSTELNKEKSKTAPKGKKPLEKASKRRNFQRSQGKLYKCQQCPKRFKAQSTLYYHQFTHSEERPFKCQFCDIGCRHPSNLNKHIKRHHENENQADNFKAFESVPSKNRSTRAGSTVTSNHSENSKPEEDSNVKDDAEGTKLQTWKGSTSQQPLKSSSPTSASLKKKRSRRKGKRSKKIFQCWFANCKKTFPSNQKLEVHCRIHTKEQPYHCDLCSKRFSQISSLGRHKKIVHLGIKSYKCPYCDKATSSSWNMKLHIHVNHKKLASVDGKVK